MYISNRKSMYIVNGKAPLMKKKLFCLATFSKYFLLQLNGHQERYKYQFLLNQSVGYYENSQNGQKTLIFKTESTA